MANTRNDDSIFPDMNHPDQQIEKYNQAFINLKETISSLSKPIKSFSDNVHALDKDLNKLTDSISKLNEQNKAAAESGNKFQETLSTLSSTFSTWKKVIDGVKAGVFTFTNVLSAGLTILTIYGPAILKWITSLTQGKDAIDKAKLSLDSLNKAFGGSDYSKAIRQLDELKINVDLANNSFLKKKDVLNQYNETLGKTMGKASSLAEVEEKLTKNGPDYIKMTLYKAAAQSALQDAAKKAYEAEQAKLKSDDDSLTFWDKVMDVLNRNPGAAGEGSRGIPNTSETADKEKKRQAEKRRAEAVASATTEMEQLEKIAAGFQKQAADIAKKTGMSFWDNFNTDTTPHKKKPKVDTSRMAQLLQAKAIDFAKQVALDKQNYDTELALLNEQFNKKLIGQEEYNKKSEELQQKFHLGIGNKIQFFNKNDFAEAQKQMQAMIDARQHEDTMARDQKKVDKALLPGQKLDAEKKLIEDKYTYEINLAAGNAEKIKALEDQKQKDITTLTQQYEQQRKEFALQNAQQVADKAFSIIQNNIKTQSDARVKGLEKDKAAELSNKNLTNTQKKAIEDKYQKKEAAEKVKAFKSEQKASILQAVINGALAVTKATSQTGVLAPFVIPGIIASTALQVATIVAQKPPQYAKGGLHYQSDGRGALLPGYSRTDNTNAYLRSGEAIVVSEAMRNPWARNLVSAINVAHGGRDFSIPNPGRGYAVGGIFTDGGNANRYYNQPVNDVKDLANTLAYQMINNFPPVYVDVKDINNQQNILAQTINRVNL
ncbi:hypothetical protein [Mucilaginibacter rubeus]|uniref:Uncharacterized protein n=1 Tax=Mucilaginibacter rubeus TaxID=2027860 RepID=A0A5C1HTW9_9SPHI|nr:hypothetical protein [Mucilaginibacter rubeus]QEM09276.1 hypothetical protein DEO27_004360 [Mucilaginibacter rubeus]